MKGWRYEVWVCESDSTRPENHDRECAEWKRAGIHWNANWFGAFEEAAGLGHALVQAIPVGIDPAWRPHVAFEWVRGGGLCRGCATKRIVVHDGYHLAQTDSETCVVCLETPRPRGPLTRTPFGKEFMCEGCRSSFRRMHERITREPDKRLYRPALDVAREDAGE